MAQIVRQVTQTTNLALTIDCYLWSTEYTSAGQGHHACGRYPSWYAVQRNDCRLKSIHLTATITRQQHTKLNHAATRHLNDSSLVKSATTNKVQSSEGEPLKIAGRRPDVLPDDRQTLSKHWSAITIAVTVGLNLCCYHMTDIIEFIITHSSLESSDMSTSTAGLFGAWEQLGQPNVTKDWHRRLWNMNDGLWG